VDGVGITRSNPELESDGFGKVYGALSDPQNLSFISAETEAALSKLNKNLTPHND